MINTNPTIAAMAQYGIGLGENPDMTSPYVRASADRIAEAAEIGEAVIASALTSLDLREFCPTPAGGYTDGAVIHVLNAGQVAADMMRWHRPDVAFRRAREILAMAPPPAAPVKVDENLRGMLCINGQHMITLEHPQSGIDCAFPVSGAGSIDDIKSRYGDDLDVLLQSAAFYVVFRGGYTFLAETTEHTPMIGSHDNGDWKMYPVCDGDKVELGNGDIYYATKFGWKLNSDEDVECEGAQL